MSLRIKRSLNEYFPCHNSRWSTWVPDTILSILQTCTQERACKIPFHFLKLDFLHYHCCNLLGTEYIPHTTSTITRSHSYSIQYLEPVATILDATGLYSILTTFLRCPSSVITGSNPGSITPSFGIFHNYDQTSLQRIPSSLHHQLQSTEVNY